MKIQRQHFKVIDSTNTWAKQHAHEFERDCLTLETAEEQTGGRGRFKRRWESPPGLNIYASFCLFVEKQRSDVGNLPQVMAISAAKVLEDLQFKPELKWPNDLLLSQKKIGGILAETVSFSDHLCLIIGIGLNVNMPQERLSRIDRPATSLFAETQRLYDVEDVLSRLQQQFSADATLFFKAGFFPFLAGYRGRMFHNHNQTSQFHDNKQVWKGAIHAINDDGSLVLKLVDGTLKTFIAGEILWPKDKNDLNDQKR
jgi:BirA family biotin operon repressor/biotin-[acetyl-CoA-carboxylase] ligase